MEFTTTTADPVLAAYLRDVDRTLLRENLKLTPAQRLEKLVRFTSFAPLCCGKLESMPARILLPIGSDDCRVRQTAAGPSARRCRFHSHRRSRRGCSRICPRDLGVDVTYSRVSNNIARLVQALHPSALGDVDLMGEVIGGGAYDDFTPGVRLRGP